MNIKSIVFSGIMLSGVLLWGCKEGEVGPEGLKGDTGAAGAIGATGPKGDKGVAGDPGNAGANGNFNVIVKNLGGGEIPAGTNGAGYSWVYTSNDFSPDVVDNSVVYVYLKSPDGGWYVLPGDVWSAASNSWHNFALRIHFENNRTSSRFRITRTRGTGILAFADARLLLVPRAVAASPSAIDFSDYAVVTEFYNLKD